MKKDDPYYNRIVDDPYYQRFVNPSWTQSTIYRAEDAFRAYLQFYEQEKELSLVPESALKRMEEDRKKPLLKQGLVEQEWLEFVEWLRTKYEKRNKGRNERLAPASIRGFANVIKQFYAESRYPFSAKIKLPRVIRQDKHGRTANQKVNLRAKDVKELLNVMKSNRDKAVTLLLFQSGMDVATAFSLKYGDIKKDFEAGKDHLILSVKRKKTTVFYRTCIGRDSVKAIRAYLKERTASRWRCDRCKASWNVKRNKCPSCSKKGITEHSITEYRNQLSPDSYLFVPNNRNRKMAQGNFDQRFRRYGLLAGIVTEEQLKKADMNPGRPYALRAAFRSILGLKGMNQDLINYMMGHSVAYNGADLGMSDDEIREIYQQHEEHLSVSEVRELADVRQEFEEKHKRQEYINAGMEKRIKELENQGKQRVKVMAGEKSELDAKIKQDIREAVDSDLEVLKDATQGFFNEIHKRDLVIDDLKHRLSELEKKEKDRAQLLAGTGSTLDVQTILQIFKAVESDPELLKEVKKKSEKMGDK